MLISEIKGWYYYISWDNPMPADSSAILRALRGLGKVTVLQTKTSIALAPKQGISWRDVRKAIEQNLNQSNGKAFYVNLRSGKGFEISRQTKWRWRFAV